jgi:hypothetical protein
MLDTALFPELALLVGHDSEKVEAFCQALSPGVNIVRGYLEDDCTVLMYRRG